MCELDIIFKFEKAYFILDEFLLRGEVQETAEKKNVHTATEQAHLLLQEEADTPCRVFAEVILTSRFFLVDGVCGICR